MSAVIGVMQVRNISIVFCREIRCQHIVYWKYEPGTSREKLSSKETIHIISVQDLYV